MQKLCLRGIRLLPLVLAAVTGAQLCVAQDSGGSLTGVVTDPSGSAVAEATVTALNIATGVKTPSVTGSRGDYRLLYLIPGTYNVTVEKEGFDRVSRENVVIRVGDEWKVDFSLKVGAVTQSVVVTDKTPVLQAENGDMGQTVTQEQIAALPIGDGNPFILARLTEGTVFLGDPKMTRPFDNADVGNIRVNGAAGSNEFSLNGMSNMGKSVSGGIQVAYIPSSDAMQEFKMTTSNFSAMTGRSAGANLNVSIKSGTNSLHGTLYEFFRNDKLAANDFFLNSAGQPRAVVRYNRFGGTLGGPVVLPKLFNGRNRLFFFFAYENLPDVFPEPGTFTVPTEAERKGDFSGLPAANIVYDPASAVTSTPGHVSRTPFPNNMVPSSRFNSIGMKLLAFYPLPDVPGKSDGTNDYVSQQSRKDQFHSYLERTDYSLSDRQKISFNYYQNWRQENRFDWGGFVNGIVSSGQDLRNINHGGSLEDVLTVSPTSVLDLRFGMTRMEAPVYPSGMGYNPADLGFSPAVMSLFRGPAYLVPFNISGFTRLQHNTNTNLYRYMASNQTAFQPRFTKILSSHTLNAGWDFRVYRENYQSFGNAEGYYNFNTTYTKATDSAASYQGQGLAALLLGQVTDGQIDRNGTRANQGLFHAIYLQDDWKATARLTLNIGVRWEFETPTTERYNQNTRGFDLTDASPVQPAAVQAFATAYPKGMPTFNGAVMNAADFRVLGGYLFANDGNRNFWNSNWGDFMPRIGFAYQLDSKTVVRGGTALYSVPKGLAGVNQAGFSQTTSMTTSGDNGLTFLANLNNPFPNGAVDPTSSSLGLMTGVGGSVTYYPMNLKTARSQMWSVSIQRQLGQQWLLQATYTGNHSYGLPISSNYLDGIPAQYLSTSPIRDAAVISALGTAMTNPFYGITPGTSFNTAKTEPLSQLLRPFPQFTGISTTVPVGNGLYESGAARIERRFHSFTLLANYTWSKLLERTTLLNDSQTTPAKGISTSDIPQRVSIAFLAELPFGKGRRWGQNWHGIVNGVLGGWQVQGIIQAQSGKPITMGNLAYFGDPSKLRTHISSSNLSNTFDTTYFYFSDAAVQTNGVPDITKQRADTRIQLASNIRTFPYTLADFRGQAMNNSDLSALKLFRFTERFVLQVRGEFLNAFNHPFFSAPSVDPTSAAFGSITSQYNLPREVQLGMRLTF